MGNFLDYSFSNLINKFKDMLDWNFYNLFNIKLR